MKRILFDVQGAGRIEISEQPHSMCGSAVGFSFGVSWGAYGFYGGVIGRDEAKKMAEYMLSEIAKCEETEEEERTRRTRELFQS